MCKICMSVMPPISTAPPPSPSNFQLTMNRATAFNGMTMLNGLTIPVKLLWCVPSKWILRADSIFYLDSNQMTSNENESSLLLFHQRVYRANTHILSQIVVVCVHICISKWFSSHFDEKKRSETNERKKNVKKRKEQINSMK